MPTFTANIIRNIVVGTLAVLTVVCGVSAQENVGIGTSTPSPSAILELQSTTKGFLPPRMTSAQRDAIALPASGLMIYNTTTDSYQYNFGVPVSPRWATVLYLDGDAGGSSNKTFWSLTGNDTINPAVNFLGTRQAQPLIFKTNNTTRLTIAPTGEIVSDGLVSIQNGGLSLNGASSVLTVNGQAGQRGQLLISSGAGVTPRWSGDIVLGDNGVSINNRLAVTKPTLFSDSVTFTIAPRMPLTSGHIWIGDANNIATPTAPGLNGAILQIVAGRPTWIAQEQASYWSLAGNAGTTPTSLLGTKDANDLRIGTNNTVRMTINANTGAVTIANLVPAPGTAPLAGTEGIVVADATGTLVKRSVQSLLQLPSNNIYVGNAQGTAAPMVPGLNGSVLQIVAGAPTWVAQEQASYWSLTGNANAGTSSYIGTRDANDLRFATSATTRLTINGTTGVLSVVTLSAAPTATALTGNDGIVIADAAGALSKRSVASLLELPQNHIWIGDVTGHAKAQAPGLNGSILQVVAGVPTWIAPTQASYWSTTGNAGTSGTALLGTNDAQDLRLATSATPRLTIGASNGSVTMTTLGGAPAVIALAPNDGFVFANAGGTVSKRSRTAALEALGIFGGRYVNSSPTIMYSVVITMPSGVTIDPQGAIILTPEATSSVSATPFVVAGSRTATSFTISFPGGMMAGEAVNWLLRNP